MAARFTYSAWDGTQKGFELDADSVFDGLTDDLLYHGDVNSALRRMMQDGFQDRNGERLQGLREIMERLRRERQERLARPRGEPRRERRHEDPRVQLDPPERQQRQRQHRHDEDR